MSCLNPNVFFEFGIRTSLNKPICVVKDEFITNVPFDTGILNHHEYKSTLEHWEIQEEIQKLTKHIMGSLQRSKGENTLWKYFGLKTNAKAYEGEIGIETKIDFLSSQIESIKNGLLNRPVNNPITVGKFKEKKSPNRTEITEIIGLWISEYAQLVKIDFVNDKNIIIKYSGYVPNQILNLLAERLINAYNITPLFNPS